MIIAKTKIMKIWFDISNSPHVLLFKDMIAELQKQGHDILVTSRPLANTIKLLDQNHISHTPIGIHYGKNTWKKVFGYPIRVYHLWKYLRKKNIDIAVSQSSFHSPLVAFLLGVPSIYTNDNEHAVGNIPAFVFANKILVPESFQIRPNALRNLVSKKTQFYPGLKEGIYLWRKSNYNDGYQQNPIQPKYKIYVRPEPSTAQYYSGGENFLDQFLLEAIPKYDITLLPRNEDQVLHYSKPEFKGLKVSVSPMSFDSITKDCDLFIGAGGSMTREMAMVGIPTISVYQDELLGVDKILLDEQAMVHKKHISLVDVEEVLSKSLRNQKTSSLMVKGKIAYDQFLQAINEFKQAV